MIGRRRCDFALMLSRRRRAFSLAAQRGCAPAASDASARSWLDEPAGADSLALVSESDWEANVATQSRAAALARVWERRITDLTSEDILLALVQGWSLSYLVPHVLEIVERDPLASGGWFAGDFVRALMEIPGRFWTHHPMLYERYRAALRAAAAARRRLPPGVRDEFWAELPRLRREESTA